MARANLKQIIFGWLAHALQMLASRFAGVSSSRDADNEDRPAIEEDVRAQWLQRYRPGQPPEDWLQRFGSSDRDSIVARVQNRAIASGSRSQGKPEHVSSLHASQDRQGRVSEIRPSYLLPSRQDLSNRGPATGAQAGSSPNTVSGHSEIPDNLTDLRSLPQGKPTVQGGGDRVPPKPEISGLAANEPAKALEVKRRARAAVPPRRMMSASQSDESSPYELMSNELLTNGSGTKNSVATKSSFSKPRGSEGNSLEGTFDHQVRRASASSAGEHPQMSSMANVEPYGTEPLLGNHTDGVFQLPHGNADDPTAHIVHSMSSVPHGRQSESYRREEQRMGPRLEEQRFKGQQSKGQRVEGQPSEDQRFESPALENASIPPSARRLHPREADAIRDGAWKSGSPLWSLPDTFEQREQSLYPSPDSSDFFPGLRRRSHAGTSNLESSPFVPNNGKDEEPSMFHSPEVDDGSHWAGASREGAEDPWPKLPEVSEEDRQEPGELLKTYKRQLRLAHEQRGIV